MMALPQTSQMRAIMVIVLVVVLSAIILNLILVSMEWDSSSTWLQLPSSYPSDPRLPGNITSSSIWSLPLIPESDANESHLATLNDEHNGSNRHSNRSISKKSDEDSHPRHLPFSHMPKLDMIPYSEVCLLRLRSGKHLSL